ncbi:MAG: ATP-dependent zinc metalloprotease FtsH [Bacteroidales bacterium]|nr:ATP-dependent zinc metalloprotease FtsH [Bacteroidales bacterium]NLP19234.1 ATP-dependent zinc metalloprotease FtsH [Bacteroidales bacterium]HNY43184.1 ATP-dependent zinc metalloprotease FtsH [Bacteroidales bacterium]HOD87942.1 ATP-dependent zinc metalloprotease FtsH [Bacteroidales bacterium]HPX76157.1 ATP-dependent zinc metalloprotease FtsH [Bacteroidales bacterium]
MPPNSSGKKPGAPNMTWLYVILFGLFLAFAFMDFGSKVQEIDRKKFETEILPSGDLEKIVVVNKEKVEVYLKPDALSKDKYKDVGKPSSFSFSKNTGPHYFFKIGSVEAFENQLAEAQQDFPPDQKIAAQYETKQNYIGVVLSWLLPFILIIGLWFLIFRRMSGGGGGSGNAIFNIGKSKAQIFDNERRVKINFNDVAGLEEAKVEIMEIVDFLKNSEKYTKLGGKIPKGVLLVGPPGTGKTLLAKAVAGEANVPFFSLSGSDFVEMFVGVGASRVRDLFKQAKAKAPCIIFIDEIDAIGRARGRNANFGGNDERENTLNQLLTEMDGFDTNSGVIILAATNRADILDSALMRAGRFDRQIHLELPDIVEREAIFKVHTRNLKMSKEVDISFLAKQTPGFSGADIANVCNEAALIAARNGKKEIEHQDFLDAVDRIVGGLERKTKIISQTEKRTIAFHEAGHATVSWLLEHANPLIKVTIIPRGRALGAAWYLPEERQLTTKEQLLDEMASTLGGRAAEELVFGEVSTGALNDLERVTKQAIAMVSFFGMSDKIGNLSYYDSSGQSDFGFTKPYSEKTSELIDAEVKAVVEEQYQRAIDILKENMEGLTELAETLLEKEVIFSDDLERIFGKRKGDKESPESVKIEQKQDEDTIAELKEETIPEAKDDKLAETNEDTVIETQEDIKTETQEN